MYDVSTFLYLFAFFLMSTIIPLILVIGLVRLFLNFCKKSYRSIRR